MKPTADDRGAAYERFVAAGLAREADLSGTACPDADLLAAWFDHTLSDDERERIGTHVSSCAFCQEMLGALARSEPAVVRAAPVPAPARPWHWHWRWLVPLATAAVVVVVGTRTLRAPGPARPAEAEAPVATAAPALAEAKTAGAENRAVRSLVAAAGAPRGSVSVEGPAGTSITWRFGQDGSIEQSIDDGRSWERQASGVSTALLDASAPADRVCWIVGAGGVVLRTTDGRTWQRLSSPTGADLVAVHAWSEASATVTASDRSVYETSDGGRTWRRR